MTTTSDQPTIPTSDVLTQASIRNLEELMQIDPLKLTQTDLRDIITQLRRARIEWERVETIKKSSGNATEKKAAKAAKAAEAAALLNELLG